MFLTDKIYSLGKRCSNYTIEAQFVPQNYTNVATFSKNCSVFLSFFSIEEYAFLLLLRGDLRIFCPAKYTTDAGVFACSSKHGKLIPGKIYEI
jgi:hypothetical protein